MGSICSTTSVNVTTDDTEVHEDEKTGCTVLQQWKSEVNHSLFMNELRDLRQVLFVGGVNRKEAYRPAFQNWSGNVESNNTLFFPKSDYDIIKKIQEAKTSGGKITAAGAGHTAAPVVCDTGEVITVMSLGSYSMSENNVSDFEVDPAGPTVTINAGWNLDQLMAKLGKDWPDYLMEAQTAGRIFSIGGLVSMCTHGGCMKAGLIADTVTRLRIIDAQGQVRIITDEEELRYYRMSMGAFGIITHVTLRLRKITELDLISTCDDLVMTEEFFEDYFKDKASWDAPLFQQLFIDFHKMKIHYGGWKETGVKRTEKDYPSLIDTRSGSRGLGGAAVVPFFDELLDIIDLNYRKSSMAISGLVEISCKVPALAWKLNVKGENDAFWVSSLPVPMPASHWTAYMVPVDLPSKRNIFKAVKVAYDTFQATEKLFKEAKGHFRPDVALECRFCWSSNSYFAPPYSEKQHSQLYFVCEQPTLSSNLYLTQAQMRKHFDSEPGMVTLTKDFTKYFADLEKGWQAIDPRTKPHLAKVFGFAPSPSEPDFLEPFNQKACGSVLSADRKAKLLTKLKEVDPTGLFRNKFINAMLE